MSTTIDLSTILPGVQVPEPGSYVIDASHSNLGVVARHLMVSKVRGFFSGVAGTVTIADNPLESSAQVAVDAATIDTRDAQRDAHLRGPDFLDAENHPQLTFVSTGFEHVKDGRFRLHGDLTIRGVTKPVTFDLDYQGIAADPWGGTRIAFEARGEIDREEFGITWNAALETGGVLVSKKLTFELEVEAVKQ